MSSKDIEEVSVSLLVGMQSHHSNNTTTVLRPFDRGEVQRRDLLEQPLDFYEPDVLPATQPTVSKHYRKTQWFGCILFYRHGISTLMSNQQCQSTEDKVKVRS